MKWDQLKRWDTQKGVRWGVMFVAFGWLIAVGWQEFSYLDTSYYFRSAYYVSSAQDKRAEQTLADRVCRGSASARYDCRSEMAISNDQRVFIAIAKKIMIVGGPPLLLLGLYRLARSPRRPDVKPRNPVRPAAPK
jgi:hypothetical protein